MTDFFIFGLPLRIEHCYESIKNQSIAGVRRFLFQYYGNPN